MRKYADKELASQKRRFNKVMAKLKEENEELRERLTKFVDEHETLKEVTEGIGERAKDVESRVKKLLSRED